MGKFLLTIALWGGLCGNAAGQPASPGPVAAPVVSGAGVHAEYAALRHAFLASLMEEGVSGILGKSAPGTCLAPWMFMAPEDQVSDDTLAELAMDAATLETLIAGGAGGVDDGNWKAQLADFEARMLALHEGGPARFSVSYASARREFALSLMPQADKLDDPAAQSGVGAHGDVLDCMAHSAGRASLGSVLQGVSSMTASLPSHPGRGVIVSLLSDPDGASIRMISRWNKLVCEGKQIDVLDFEACTGWTELAAGSSARVLGDYHYHATWPDGSSKSGQIAFNRSLRTARVVFGKSGPLVR